MSADKKEISSKNTNTLKSILIKGRSNQYFGPLLTLLIIIAIFALGTGGVNIKISNFQNMLSLAGLFMIAVQGMTMCFLMGAMDLSTEGVIALSAVVTGILIEKNPGLIFPVFLIVLVVGFIVGMISGLIHTKFRMPSFLVTLGMWYVTRGLAVMVIQGQQIAINNSSMKFIVDGKILGGVPLVAIIALGFFGVYFVIQKHTGFGKRVYAIGGNEILAIQAGVRVNRIKIVVMGMAAMCYAAVGFLLVSRLQIASAQIGQDYMFPVVIASVLGGTALSGGLGGAVNAVIGALAYMFLQNGMILMNINVYAQAAVNGIVLIAAVTISMDRKKIGILK